MIPYDVMFMIMDTLIKCKHVCAISLLRHINRFAQNTRIIRRNDRLFAFMKPLKHNAPARSGKQNLQAAWYTFPLIAAFGISWKKNTGNKQAVAPRENWQTSFLRKADLLYADNNVEGLYEFLVAQSDNQHDEILWRLARATADLAKATSDVARKKALTYEAFDYIKRALVANENNFAVHKWYAILLDNVGEYEGTKKRISYAFTVKQHFMKAAELNPNDATSVYSLGYWCFLFADMPWYQQTIAAVIFTAPPTSSYEEALSYFLAAEKVDPNFYSMNLLMLGKTYQRLNDKAMALQYLRRARDYPVRTHDDKAAHNEAIELLKSMGDEQGA